MRYICCLLFILNLAHAQFTNNSKTVEIDYSATFGKLTTLQWQSVHDMDKLDNIYNYHFKYLGAFSSLANHFSFFLAQDGTICNPINSRSFGISWQESRPNFNMLFSLVDQQHPWSAADNGLRLKIDINSHFK